MTPASASGNGDTAPRRSTNAVLSPYLLDEITMTRAGFERERGDSALLPGRR
jgi:hypothetical protein